MKKKKEKKGNHTQENFVSRTGRERGREEGG